MPQRIQVSQELGDPQPLQDPKMSLDASENSEFTWHLGTHNHSRTPKWVWMPQGVQIPQGVEDPQPL